MFTVQKSKKFYKKFDFTIGIFEKNQKNQKTENEKKGTELRVWIGEVIFLLRHKKRVMERTGSMMREMEDSFKRGERTITSLLTLGMIYRQYNLMGKGAIVMQSRMNNDPREEGQRAWSRVPGLCIKFMSQS